MSNNTEEYWTSPHGATYYRADMNSTWVPLGQRFNAGGPSQPSNMRPINPTGFESPMPSGHNAAQGSQLVLPPIREVDPAEYPLPDDDEDDFAPQRILDKVARPSGKVAGSRRPIADPKGKGKQRAIDHPAERGPGGIKRKAAAPLPPATDNVKKPKGRAAGASNYSPDDVDSLLNILEEFLPLGGNAWNSVGDDFNIWAEANGRPTRTAKSLETKYKQLVKTTKPTGDAECPPHIERAQYIDDLMNEKAGSRDLDDEDFVDEPDDVVEVSDTEVQKPSSTKLSKKVDVKVEKNDAPIARRQQSDRTREVRPAARNSNLELLSNISSALDPRNRQAREEANSMTSMQATQIFQLSSQVREMQRQLETARSQLADAERCYNAAERRADRAEMLNMMRTQQDTPSPGPRWAPFDASARHRSSTSRATAEPQHRRLHRQDIHYRGGGKSTRWIGPDDDNLEVQGVYDSPGTRRFTFASDDDDPPSPFCNGVLTQARPGSPFRSASSPLNNILRPTFSQESQVSVPEISITVSPSHHVKVREMHMDDEDKENIPFGQ